MPKESFKIWKLMRIVAVVVLTVPAPNDYSVWIEKKMMFFE